MPRFRFVYDVNRYYADLGVAHTATRREIRKAYCRKQGHRSPRLTYIVKQLLNPVVRAAYDATPLGSLFMDDFIEARLREARVAHVAELRRRGLISDAEWLEDQALGDETLEVVDIIDSRDEDVSPPRRWPWAYYLWWTETQDVERLRVWQELLIASLGSRKEHHQIAVGLSGGDMAYPWGVEKVGYRIVVFLHTDEWPTEALAQAASRAVESLRLETTEHELEINKCLTDQASVRVPRQQRRLPKVELSPAPSSSSWRTARPPSSVS